jgi:hypothetical protein
MPALLQEMLQLLLELLLLLLTLLEQLLKPPEPPLPLLPLPLLNLPLQLLLLLELQELLLPAFQLLTGRQALLLHLLEQLLKPPELPLPLYLLQPVQPLSLQLKAQSQRRCQTVQMV